MAIAQIRAAVLSMLGLVDIDRLDPSDAAGPRNAAVQPLYPGLELTDASDVRWHGVAWRGVTRRDEPRRPR